MAEQPAASLTPACGGFLQGGIVRPRVATGDLVKSRKVKIAERGVLRKDTGTGNSHRHAIEKNI